MDIDLLLKKHPQILAKINDTWGTAECRKLLVSLISDSRDGSRQGFDPAVASTLMRLLIEHDKGFPQLDTTTDIIVPFRSARDEVATQSQHEGVVLNFLAKCVVVILFLFLLLNLYKHIS